MQQRRTNCSRFAILLLPAVLASYSLFCESDVFVAIRRLSLFTTNVTAVQALLEESSSSTSSLMMKQQRRPSLVWLASYPNSGTSYTMMLVERATNQSTATNYGPEVTAPGDTSLAVFPDTHPNGPFWEGMSGKLGTIRDLPRNYILTKTHCGGRCVKCGAKKYVINNTSRFMEDCERTEFFKSAQGQDTRVEPLSNSRSLVSKVVHLIRNPLHNIVARFHLERSHMIRARPELDAVMHNNAAGFAVWCNEIDGVLPNEVDQVFDAATVQLLRAVPCHAEFFRYAQWHELTMQMISELGAESRIVHYEDYQYRYNATVDALLEFVKQPFVGYLSPFRSLPAYDEFFTRKQRVAVKRLLRHVSSRRVWKEIEMYFADPQEAVAVALRE
jgi:hypothetical protein